MVMADGCKLFSVTNHWSLEALLRSWGMLPRYGFCLPGALPAQPAQPWPRSMAEISHAGPIYVVLTAVYLCGAALASLCIASKDIVAVGSLANVTKHLAESRGQSGGPLLSGIYCLQHCKARAG